MLPSEQIRSIGALVGAAIGDAAGTTNEFSNPHAPRYPTLMNGPQTDIVGGGPFDVAAGQITDDTQMAVALARSVAANRRFDPDAVRSEYVRWLRTPPFDVGGTTFRSLTQPVSGDDPLSGGRAVWESSGRSLASNGSLMRTWILGVAFCHDEEARREASLLDSAITHFDPACRLACAIFNTAIAHAIVGESPLDCAIAASEELNASAERLRVLHPDLSDVIDSRRSELSRDLSLAHNDDPELYGTETHLLGLAGYVRLAFRLAFWHLLHAKSYETSLVDVVNRGGDSDTNGCAVGALLGARFGSPAFPSDG